ncbi:MAG: 30S ribosomal protein S20 [Methylococcales bacterium]|jgi:small subunit ribosomal protein S20|nr:30S ribosomal protein S20 [Methylococcales bacterium]MEE2766514.1 30S ribosomal protein S20 [Pseudomonadota bacterium]
MANSLSAAKRARQAVQIRSRKTGQRGNLRTAIKKVIAAVAQGDLEQAQTAYRNAVPVIDSAVNKGLIHKNKAARNKSRLNNQVRGLKA